MEYNLSSICDYAKDKIETSFIDYDNYISTENMLANKRGISRASSLPTLDQTQAFKAGDVLVSNIRPYFKKIWYAEWDGGCSNDVLVFRAKEGINSRFLYYVLADDTFFSYSMTTSKGTKMPRGDKTAIMRYLVPCYTRQQQDRIAEILAVFDKKIQLNVKMNENLYKQIKCIFKHYFSDNPQLQSMPQLPLEKLCTTITKGTTPTTLGRSFATAGINFVKAESILDNHTIDKNKIAYIDEETNDLLRRSVINAGDIVFTIAGTLGRYAFIDDSILPANTNQAVAIIRTDRTKVESEYIYSFFIGDWHNEYYTKRIQQAVQANLSLGTIKSLPIPVLPEPQRTEYVSLVRPIITMTKINEKEISHLEALRDTLLPQLMSGKVNVDTYQL